MWQDNEKVLNNWQIEARNVYLRLAILCLATEGLS